MAKTSSTSSSQSQTVSQSTHPIGITTPLGTDVLLLESFTGQETMSQPFNFRADLLALQTSTIAFEKLLGQSVTIRLDLPDSQERYFNGLVSRLTQGRVLRGVEAQVTYVRYRMEIVPQFWMLTHNAQSRIFQQMTVPAILQQVLTNLNVSYQIQGTFQPRDYCVQYRETDFHFASRLMEEEGIYYYFTHTSSSHQMVVANTPQSNANVPGATTINYEDVLRRSRTDERIIGWEKSQELRAGKVTLRDYCFEMPTNNFQTSRPATQTTTIGTVTHKLLQVGGNDSMELYDFPGGFAGRFDGVDSGGGAQASNLQNISTDGTRTATIRMGQEMLAAVLIAGNSDCRQLASGCQFTLANHPNANGSYVLTRVEHSASVKGAYTTTEVPSLKYENNFQCIPLALPYVPPRLTPKARVAGTQTAVVVGPQGQEIFTDQYGRVKVQFFWDRVGQNNANSSCWIRVATLWAGQQWGMIHIPRIGQEVVVDFLEGDPDQPIIVGSVYNATNMPPNTLPANATQSGLRTRSSLKGAATNFSELRFEDKKGSEYVYFHSEKDFIREVENNDTISIAGNETIGIGGDQTITVKGNRYETVQTGNESITIAQGNRTVVVTQGNESLQVNTGNREVIVKTGNDTHDVKTGNRSVTVDTGNDTHEIKTGNRTVKIDMGNDNLTISMGNQTTQVSLGKSSTTAMQGIELTVGENSIKIDQTGVTIQGLMITLNGQVQTQVKGTMVQVQGSAMTQIQGGITMIG